jgi:hypothetical protein
MAKKSKSELVQDAFVNALSFHSATNALSQCPGNPVDKLLLYWPTVVCEAFALELFIKCLLMLRGRKPKKNHDVEGLFKLLSNADQQKIAKYLHEGVTRDDRYDLAAAHGIRLDIDSVLQRTKDSFLRIRYWHEHVPPSPDAHGTRSNAGVGALVVAIYRLLNELRPEWQNMSYSIPVLLENLPLPTKKK